MMYALFCGGEPGKTPTLPCVSTALRGQDTAFSLFCSTALRGQDTAFALFVPLPFVTRHRPCLAVLTPTAWTILEEDGPNHLVLWCNAYP